MIYRRRTMGEGRSGIYVMTPDGKEIHTERATTDCIGVVVRDADKGVAFLIPKIIINSRKPRMKWNDNISTAVPGVTTTNDRSVAQVDYKGKDNSDAMREFDDSTSYAAGFCNSETLTIGEVSKNGYLGSFGEWYIIIQNMSLINSAMVAIGGAYFTNGEYWTSTLRTDATAWGIYLDPYNSHNSQKNVDVMVMPFYDLR